MKLIGATEHVFERFPIQAQPLYASSSLAAGSYSVPWDGRDDSRRDGGSGAYLYVLETRSTKTSRALQLVR
ncbi:MAG: hypothetical protein QGH20_10415 [Candidatus Latescibacteria bacterium]|nr:hypothetical protein [Candidatus Latescibacterota bacterium]